VGGAILVSDEATRVHTLVGGAVGCNVFVICPFRNVSFHGEFGRVTGPAFGVAALPKIAKIDEPALVSAVGGAGSAMLFSVAAAI